MNTECFIKSFMLIAVILLMISCLQTTEKFAEIDFSKLQAKKSVTMNLTIGNELYYLISYDQLSNANKGKIIDKLVTDKKFMDSRENENDVKKGIFYKTPVFLASAGQIAGLTNNSKLNFVLTAEAGAYALTPENTGIVASDKYLFFNKDLGFAYYAKEGPNSDIVHINKNGFVKPFGPEKSGQFSELNLISLGLVSGNDKFNVNITQN